MTKISHYYGIAGSLPFVDVELSEDNFLFVDPHAVRLSGTPQPFASNAVRCGDTFLGEVLSCVISGAPADMRRGEDLLRHFTEPWETRLGMSSAGFHGHGGADGVGSMIWDTINGDVEALVRITALKQLEDLPLFVEGIDRDITSDVTTRIIFEPLGRFTEDMVARYPEFTSNGHTLKTVTKQVWDPNTLAWTTAEFTLPVVDGKVLVLVPVDWARRNLLMNATRFYETSVLSYVQFKRAVRMSDGKLLKTPKDRLAKQPGLGRGRDTNRRVTLDAFDDAEDLLASFKAFVASKYVRATPRDSAA
jgi:hypothetical protein